MPALTYEQLAQQLRETREQRDELAQMVREACQKLDRCLPAGGQFWLKRVNEMLPQEDAEA
ncbi:hypothetical protein [Delftia acidovorans]|uniref:hypothetical protein n=1 Tax=Delftia acidovorans TaxID=80866 RepID=UPI000BC32465|nr:hypothetical protein [Delftia acidovorans]ATH15834.1 hypothetical protein CHL79_27190 [Delftia acidovorans]SOE35256.1 hypothetical protein SAMN05216519_1236 [Delftia acidovorans]